MAGLCNGASRHGLALPGMVGLLWCCGSPGHSPTQGQAAVVPGGEEGCPSHSSDAQLGPAKPRSGAAAQLPGAAGSILCHPPAVRAGGCPCISPACPSWSSPAPAASPHAPALTSMPAPLWMLSSSPASSGAGEPKGSQEQPHRYPGEETLTTYCALLCMGIFSPNACLQKSEIKMGKSTDHSPAATMACQEPFGLDLWLCQGSHAYVLTLRAVDVPDFAAAVLPHFANTLANCLPIPWSCEGF